MSEQQPVERTTRLWTVPNVLCFIRLIGSPFLISLAIIDQRIAFVGLFVFLTMTDWLDGKLAILLNQRSVWGAKIDSWADAAMYACTLLGVLWLCWTQLAEDWIYIAVVLGLYAVGIVFSLLKFGSWPSYHTRSAKLAWLAVLIGVSFLVATDAVWPFRIAIACVLVAVIEAIVITAVLKESRVNVSSILSVRKEP